MNGGQSARKAEQQAGRRRFLQGVGVSGVAAATVIFGRATPAEAVTAGCCNLCKSPTSYSSCTTGTYYAWSCPYGGSQYLHCHCCEKGTTSHTCTGVTASAYKCEYA